MMCPLVQSELRMRRDVLALAVACVIVVVCVHGRAYGQEPPSRLPRIVVDLHGIIPVFPNDNAQLAKSRCVSDQARQLSVGELPGAGLGGRVGVHLYLLKWRAMTIGLGGEVLVGRSTSTPIDTTAAFVAVNESLTSADGQVSFNFGSAHGWSYLSGGIGRSQWSIVPAG